VGKRTQHGRQISGLEKQKIKDNLATPKVLAPWLLWPPLNLRLLEPSGRTLTIETNNTTYAAVTDSQRNIRRLISSPTDITSYDFTAFGELRSHHPNHVPWTFASKRVDPDLHFVSFGQRLYDPSTGRWLTPDPAGLLDSSNPYQFNFNKPLRYHDPNGEFAIVIPLLNVAISAGTAAITGMASGLILGVALSDALKTAPPSSSGLTGRSRPLKNT
jgi:RHS repeat-associated protein